MALDQAIVTILVVLGIGSLLWIRVRSSRSVKKDAAEKLGKD